MEPQEQQSAQPASLWAKIRGCLRCLWKGFYMAVVVLAVALVLYAAIRFIPESPVTYKNMEDHFKYGSTRGDLVAGFPSWIWQAMPLVCADTLKSVAGDRLAPDYLDRVNNYTSGEGAVPELERRELSREGYKALGFIYEPGANEQERDFPIGTSQRRSLGFDRVFLNCAACHSSTVRKDPKDPGKVVLGMPANLFNLYDFEQFLFQCAKGERFNELNIIPEIKALGGDVGWFNLINEYLVYPITIWVMKDAIQFLEGITGFSALQPKWGPGRNDTFTNNKNFLYGDLRVRSLQGNPMLDWWKTGKVHPEDIGTVDFPSTWLQAKRESRSDGSSMQLHWDGNNDMVEERNLNASLATGALPPVIDHESIECIEWWMETLEPPKYMFPVAQALARKGAPIYDEYCADCHGRSGRDFEGKKVGFVSPIDEIGTDRYRLDNYTEILALNMATTYAGQEKTLRPHKCPGGSTYQPPYRRAGSRNTAYGRAAAIEEEEGTYRYKHFRKTNGYANMPLDGVWLRAPYLHNGSVPSLRDLLDPSEKRPKVFYRGNDVYDPKNVGFVATESKDTNDRAFFKFETDIPGNGNQGHEGPSFGTDLAPEEKDALIEYLKTF
ncbi:MAG: di-heme-cytochrome C peroxidase [Gammaproteobacteria bacterium]